MRALVRLARGGVLGVALSVSTVAVTSLPQDAYAFGLPFHFSPVGDLVAAVGSFAGAGFLAMAAEAAVGAVAAGTIAIGWPIALAAGAVVAAGVGMYFAWKAIGPYFSKVLGFLNGGHGGLPSNPGLPGQGGNTGPGMPPAPVPSLGHNGVPSPPTPGGGGNGNGNGNGGNGGGGHPTPSGSGFPVHAPNAPTTGPSTPAPVTSLAGSNTGRYSSTTIAGTSLAATTSALPPETRGIGQPR